MENAASGCNGDQFCFITFCVSGLADLAASRPVSPGHLAGETVAQLPALSVSIFTNPGCCAIICCAIQAASG